MIITTQTIKEILPQCRSRETSSDEAHWSKDNASYRQCLVTAILANELLGWSIHAEKVIVQSREQLYHYFNKDQEGNTIRLCEDQFLFENIETLP